MPPQKFFASAAYANLPLVSSLFAMPYQGDLLGSHFIVYYIVGLRCNTTLPFVSSLFAMPYQGYLLRSHFIVYYIVGKGFH